MRYVSTRGRADPLDFAGVLRAGLAEDGGLFVPEHWPELSPAEWRSLRPLAYPELASRIISLFTGDAIGAGALARACADAYAGFAHPAVAPLVQLDAGLWVQELFHGPTLAFKDFALQLVARLLTPEPESGRMVLIGATSGDTGSAAIAAFANRADLAIAILHPHGRTSDIQRRQMTTVHASNVLNLAVDGSFDDCQDLVKALFTDARLRARARLVAINSINWGRISAQVVYFAAAALALGAPDRPVAVAVPTGNFGNVLAAWIARRMGLPIERLIVASNRNDILTRFLVENDMSTRAVQPSLSPSMDIQVSSNFERLLFELLDRDSDALRAVMREFRTTGRMPVPKSSWIKAREVFVGHRADDALTSRVMREVRATTGYLADPHTAVALAAAKTAPPGIPLIVAATAHPAKFPDAVLAATGTPPPMPENLTGLGDRPEYYDVVPNDLDVIRAAVERLTRG